MRNYDDSIDYILQPSFLWEEIQLIESLQTSDSDLKLISFVWFKRVVTLEFDKFCS